MGSRAREGAKAMSLAFVFLDFQHAGVRNLASDQYTEKNSSPNTLQLGPSPSIISIRLMLAGLAQR